MTAYYFVQLAQQFLEFEYGFAMGAMLYLVVQDIIPESLDAGADLDHGISYLGGGAALGVVGFLPLLAVL